MQHSNHIFFYVLTLAQAN